MADIAKTKDDYGISDHYIICNWTDKADTIIRQLHHETIKDIKPIIIITSNPERIPTNDDQEYRGVLTIIGDPASAVMLQRAGVKKAKAVIVLADNENIEEADSKSIMTVLAIDSLASSVHVIVELINSGNRMYFDYTHANEIVCLEEISEKTLAQAALTPGLSIVYSDLLTKSDDSNEIYQEAIPNCFVGQTYEHMEREIVKIDEQNVILIGFSTKVYKQDKDDVCIKDSYGNCIEEKKVVINPESSSDSEFSKKRIMQEEDTIFLIAYNQPNLNSFYRNKGIEGSFDIIDS